LASTTRRLWSLLDPIFGSFVYVVTSDHSSFANRSRLGEVAPDMARSQPEV
jgi:hypothetical protein